jgi:hypothetical protein
MLNTIILKLKHKMKRKKKEGTFKNDRIWGNLETVKACIIGMPKCKE